MELKGRGRRKGRRAGGRVVGGWVGLKGSSGVCVFCASREGGGVGSIGICVGGGAGYEAGAAFRCSPRAVIRLDRT